MFYPPTLLDQEDKSDDVEFHGWHRTQAAITHAKNISPTIVNVTHKVSGILPPYKGED
jgi:hypothetical protein